MKWLVLNCPKRTKINIKTGTEIILKRNGPGDNLDRTHTSRVRAASREGVLKRALNWVNRFNNARTLISVCVTERRTEIRADGNRCHIMPTSYTKAYCGRRREIVDFDSRPLIITLPTVIYINFLFGICSFDLCGNEHFLKHLTWVWS